MYQFRVYLTFSKYTGGELLAARLQGKTPDLAAWVDLRELEVTPDRHTVECLPTQEDYRKLDEMSRTATVAELQEKLAGEVEARNNAYKERNQCVAALAYMARLLGYPVGLREHQDQDGQDWGDEWRNVVFIDLPTGQVSWHIHRDELPYFAGLPDYPDQWDGHDTIEKYARLYAFFTSDFGEEYRPTRISWRRADGTQETLYARDESRIEERLHGLFMAHMSGKIFDLYIGH